MPNESSEPRRRKLPPAINRPKRNYPAILREKDADAKPPAAPAPKPASFLSRLLHFIFGRPLPLESETTFFILVSAGDIFMTYLLIRFFGFREANPIAKLFFVHHHSESGMQFDASGLVYFKMAMVGLVTVIAQVIALRQVETARRLLKFATLLVVCVILYGIATFLRSRGAL